LQTNQLNKCIADFLRTIVVTTLLATLVSGCGFQLRGSEGRQVDHEPVAVTLPRDVYPLGPLLYQALQQFNFNFSEDVSKSYFNLNIIDADLHRRSLLIDKNGRAAEYEIIISVTVSIISKKHPEGIERVFQRRGHYTFDLAQSQAKDREEKALTTSLYQKISTDIVRVLSLMVRE
jgi:LPS-assembly lipoprotein